MIPLIQGRCIRAFACLAAAVAAAPLRAASCDIDPQGVSFGAYDPTDGDDLDGVGNIGIDCDAVVSFTISLSAGAGSFSSRTMTGGGDPLAYNLFTSAQRIVVWGDDTGGTATVSATAQNADIPVHGTVTARQNVSPGAYGDTLIITVTY